MTKSDTTLDETRSDGLNNKQRRFVDEYAKDCNGTRAARASGYVHSTPLTRNPDVQKAVDAKLQEIADTCRLDATYVREYILGVLELDPLEYFEYNPVLGWYIDIEKLKLLPKEKRALLIVEIEHGQRGTFFKVRFPSKEAALALAAKFTLTQKVAANVNVFNWDALVEDAAAELADPLEEKLRELAQAER